MDLFVLIVSAVVVAIGYAWYHSGYWKRRGIPGPDAVPFLGNLHQLGLANNRPHPLTLREWTKKYGKYFGVQRGWVNTLVISDPKMAMEVMSGQFEIFHERDHPPLSGNVDRDPYNHVFLSRGEKWKRLRSLTAPAFSAQSLRNVHSTVEFSAAESIQHLEAAAGREVNAQTYYREFTMDVICRIALGRTDLRQFQNEYTAMITSLMDNVEDPFFLASWLLPGLGGVLNGFRMVSAICSAHLRKMIWLMRGVLFCVTERKKQRAADGFEGEANDFIDLFLDAESEEMESELTKDTTGVYDKSNHNIVKKLSLNEVVGQCMLFLFAGFDTTANTLAFSTYYLAKNPEIQRKCREEIEEHCRSAEPTIAELQNLRYCEALMKETLRHHPVAAVITSRRATRDTVIGEVPVEAGTNVVLDVLSLHFDKELWGEDADEFRPERWLDDERRVPQAFYAFGGGPRVCAGQRLATMEHKVYLVHLLRRFRILPTATMDEMKVVGYVMRPTQVTVRLEDAYPQ